MTTRKKPNPPAPTRAVCYVRISQDRDDESSTDTQEASVRAHCKTHGWTIVDVIVEPGRSAYKASRSNRPGFLKARQMIDAGAANALIVWKLDRAGRNAEDILKLDRELKEQGARFVSVTEGFDTGMSTGKMMLTMLSGLAEMESATKSERTAAWHGHRRANGGTPTGPRPFGYQREKNRLLIDKDEAPVLRKMAKRVLRGESLRSLATELAADGVVGTSGAPFTRQTLRQLLVNPTIAGCRRTAKKGVYAEGGWKPIIDRETWDELRAVLTDRDRRTGPGNTRRWWLSGIAVCGRCPVDPDRGAQKMGVVSHKSGPRYYCPECHLSIAVADTDEVVERDLLAMLDPKTWRRLRRRPRSGGKVDAAGFEKAVEELSARFIAGDIDHTELADFAESLRLAQEVSTTPAPSLPDIADLKKAWPTFDLEQRRLVIRAATESLTIKPWANTYRFDETRIVWVPVE